MSKDFLFTSESVAEGHPDKVCDQLSDAVLDAIINNTPLEERTRCRAAVESLTTTQQLTLAGEIRQVNPGQVLDFEKIARNVIKDIGYDRPDEGFDYVNCKVSVNIHEQSGEISEMVDDGGAGDQGLMFGFAVDETPEYMPLPIILAHRLVERMDEARRDGTVESIRPDGKSQVTVRYSDGKPVAIEKVVLAVPHEQTLDKTTMGDNLYHHVVRPLLGEYGYEFQPRNDGNNHNYIVNGTGDWHIGGPASDTGLTGRKIIVDTYGGMGRHGGGCFSGKDPSKVDRSASYMVRYIAKNIVASGLAKRCEIQLAYVIGMAEPVSVLVETFGTGTLPDGKLAEIVQEVFDLSPKGIISTLDLFRPIYRRTSCYGHFGREIADFTWEKTDKVSDLRELSKS